MDRAFFVGLSFAFFMAYSLIASALLINTSTLAPIGANEPENCEDAGFVLPGDPCYAQFAQDIPVIGRFLAGASNIIEVSGQLFSGFFQLITFQAGLGAASFITLMIFLPLGAINAFIIFSAIRGS